MCLYFQKYLRHQLLFTIRILSKDSRTALGYLKTNSDLVGTRIGPEVSARHFSKHDSRFLSFK